MSVRKRVGFNFFKPYTTTDEGEDILINLTHLLEEVRLRYQRARETGEEDYKVIYNYNDEPARLANISIDYDTQFYHLIFERLDYVLPNRTTLHGDSTVVELEDDEYIGHDVSVLYDPTHHILMIQRNRSSLSPSGIEGCLRTLLKEYGVTDSFNLVIIIDRTAKRRAFNQRAYRKIQMKVTGVKANDIIERWWGKTPNGIDVVEITLSSGLKKTDELDYDFSKELLEHYVDDEEVKSLKIRAREEEGENVEPIDLIEHKVQTFATFRINDDRQINPISVFDQMVFLYNDDQRGMKRRILRM